MTQTKDQPELLLSPALKQNTSRVKSDEPRPESNGQSSDAGKPKVTVEESSPVSALLKEDPFSNETSQELFNAIGNYLLFNLPVCRRSILC